MCFHDMLEKIWRQQKKKNSGCRGEGRIMGGGYRIFRAVKLLFCMILFKRGIFIIHLLKPIGCATPRVNPNVKYGL